MWLGKDREEAGKDCSAKHYLWQALDAKMSLGAWHHIAMARQRVIEADEPTCVLECAGVPHPLGVYMGNLESFVGIVSPFQREGNC